MAALPSFASPLAWTIVAPHRNGYELLDLNIMDGPRLAAAPNRFFPNEWTPAVVKAAQTRLGQVYLGFSRFPAVQSIVDRDGSVVVRWNDMRFVTGIRRNEQGTQPAAFSAAVQFDPKGTVLEQRFGPWVDR